VAREIKEHGLVSPVDLPGEPIGGGRPLARAFVTLAVAAIGLLFANAGTLSAWVDEKPVSETQLQVSLIASGWTAMMDADGVTAPRHALHAWWKEAQAARFADEAQGEAQ